MKLLASILALLLLFGCGAKNETPAPTEDPAIRPPAQLWTRTDAPTGMHYQRAWLYSATAETEDPETLAALVETIRALKVGARSTQVTEDYTDILTFTFADGGTLRLWFENQCVFTDDGTRWEVEALDRLRAILDGLVEETGE